jgi:hypothetical protein
MQTRGNLFMNRILLTSTALVAFAGAAAADGHTNISTAFGATLGYNNDALGDNDGFYWEGNMKTTATATLDNGLTAGAYFEIEVASETAGQTDGSGQALSSSDFVVSLTADGAGLYFGDTSTAATKHWVAAGDMESDGFTSGTNSNVLRGDYSVAGFDTSLSYIWDDTANTVEQLSFGAGGSFGAFTVAVAYQEETTFADGNGDFNGDNIYGVSVGGTFAGATVTAAYASNETDGTNSTGIKLAYPFGPVTATVYYVNEAGGANTDPNYGVNVAYAANGISATVDYQDDQGAQIWSVNASYDLGNGLMVIGGAENNNEADVDYYVGAKYDLGGGASVLMTYAEDADDDQGDEIGSGDYQDGVTVEVSFAF